MAVTLPLARTVSRHLSSRSAQALTRLQGTTSLLRVTNSDPHGSATSKWPYEHASRVHRPSQCRTYATASDEPATQKKSSTRRKASGGSTKSKVTKAKKPAAKKKAVKPKPKPKKRVVVKKAKTRAKPGRKLTEAGKEKAATKLRNKEIKELKQNALLSEPTKLPDQAYQVALREKNTKGMSLQELQETWKATAQEYRNATPAELERLNHIANGNSATNKKAYQDWVLSFTPAQIMGANSARRKLRTLKSSTKGLPMIKDDRLVKHPETAYIIFSNERHQSGDFKSISVLDAAKLIGKEWKELDESAKQPYEEKSVQNRKQYLAEYESVYGKPLPSRKRSEAKINPEA